MLLTLEFASDYTPQGFRISENGWGVPLGNNPARNAVVSRSLQIQPPMRLAYRIAWHQGFVPKILSNGDMIASSHRPSETHDIHPPTLPEMRKSLVVLVVFIMVSHSIGGGTGFDFTAKLVGLTGLMQLMEVSKWYTFGLQNGYTYPQLTLIQHLTLRQRKTPLDGGPGSRCSTHLCCTSPTCVHAPWPFVCAGSPGQIPL